MMKQSGTQPKIRMIAFVETANPLNGPLPHNKASQLLKLDHSQVVYEGSSPEKTGSKNGSSQIFSINGIRGLLREQLRTTAQELDCELCLVDERYFSGRFLFEVEESSFLASQGG